MPPTVAELEARLEERLAPRERVRILVDIARGLQDSDSARTESAAREAIDIARAVDDPEGLANATFQLGRNRYLQADYGAAIELVTQAQPLFRQVGDPSGAAICDSLLGVIFSFLSDYRSALAHYERALTGFIETGDLGRQAGTLNNVSRIEVQLGNFTAALELMDEAFELRRRSGSDEELCYDLNNAAFARVQKARSHLKAGDVAPCVEECERAIRMLERAMELARAAGDGRTELGSLLTTGEAWQAMGRHAEALAVFERGIGIARTRGDPWMEAYGRACVGESLQATGHSAAAVPELAAARDAFERIGTQEEVSRISRNLAAVYESLGDYAHAFASLRTATTIDEARRSEEIHRQVRALATRRRAESAERETARLRDLAFTDPLTGLANRRHVDQRLPEMLARASAERPVTVVLGDVDHFKQINDRFSHAIGDAVLQRVGAILRAHSRSGDVAGRYGGEEFILVLEGLDATAARDAAERVRGAIETHDWSDIAAGLAVTISLGIADSGAHASAAGIVGAADAGLYAAKRDGRNRLRPAPRGG